jgi:PAS domain S-box-containing protein
MRCIGDWSCGKKIHLSITALPLFDQNNNCQAIIASIEDITDQERTNREVEKTYHLYQKNLENVFGIPYFLNFKTMQYDYFGSKSKDILGIPHNQMTYAKMQSMISETYLLHPQSSANLSDAIRLLKAGKIQHYHADLHLKTPQGQEKWISDRAVLIRDETTHEISGSWGILVDISDRIHIQRELFDSRNAALNLLEDLTLVIEEQKKIEEALKESEYKFRTLFEQSPDMNLLFDLEGNIKDFNHNTIRRLGYTTAELLQMNIMDFDPDANRRGDIEIYWQELDQNNLATFQTHNRCKDGSIFPVEVTIGKIRLKEQDYILGMGRDISERVHTEHALKESEYKFRTLFEQSPDIIVLHDLDGNIQDFNQNTIRRFGYTATELLNMNVTDIDPDAVDRGDSEKYWNKLEQNDQVTIQTQNRCKNGTNLPVEVILNKIKLKDKDYIQVIARDISDRIRAEEALRQSEALLTASQKIAKVGGWEWDIYQQNMYWTDETYQIHDLDKNQILFGSQEHISQSLKCYLPHDRDIILNAFRKCATEGIPYDLEFPFITSKGRHLWIRTTAEPISSDGEITKVVGVIMDITEYHEAIERRKKSEIQLRALAAHLQDIREDERKAIAREIHDEIAQILTALKIELTLFSSELLESDIESKKKYITEIQSMKALIDATIRKIREMIRRLRPESLESMGISEAMRWLIKDLTKDVKMISYYRSFIKKINLDNEQQQAVFRIFQEAVTNAVRHSQASRLFVFLNQKNDHLILKIRDNGIGMDLSKIEQSDRFGLIGMQERAVSLKGILSITSAPGKGTTLILKIPLSNAAQ